MNRSSPRITRNKMLINKTLLKRLSSQALDFWPILSLNQHTIWPEERLAGWLQEKAFSARSLIMPPFQPIP